MSPIVVATDHSSDANRAMLRAAILAKQQDVELHLLHVIAPLALYPGQELGSVDDRAIPSSLAEQAEATARVLRERYAIRVQVAQRIGRTHRQIADYAAKVEASLVVVGARGNSSLLRLLLGSTVWRLIRVSRCPVLIVRGEPVAAYRRVLAAVDFFPHSHAVVDWARRLAAEGHLQTLHALEPLDESALRAQGMDLAAIKQEREDMRTIATNLMANLCAELPESVLRRVESRGDRPVESGYPSNIILEVATDWHAELIVLGRQGRGGLEDFLVGSVSKNVAQEAACDVLLVGTL